MNRKTSDKGQAEMTCIEFRQYVGADPGSQAAKIVEHRQTCPACAEFYRQQLALSGQLANAMDIAVPDELASRIHWRTANARPGRRYFQWAALAASLLAVVALASFFWPGNADGPLPAGVIAHVQSEAHIMRVSNERVTPRQVSTVLALDNLAVSDELGNVSHAGLCPFRGQWIPHLVVEVDGQPVSVLFMGGEQVEGIEHINEGGYHGIIVPADNGSMAIVSEREDLLIPVVEEMRHKIRWGI